ncbi:transcription regulator protein BACH2 isoform X2 [Fopius arisanus]|nr:PREDICTED: transcription regulator protein BACH2 isoform X2 [Fopius arisanus]XP_011305549.1 PREDICTED: transcription regulator protein BACH2 isoform X2 [Fopius arisanus]XP_011305550.1 PREDICTED: transcription regulator protein BACH2 isoform X2 [Fopius arisanus]
MDSHQQQFCLKWNSFGSNLATAFSNLFKSESLTDVTLFCEGVTFKAHRLILAACSKHFQELFEGMPPSPAGLIVILDGTSAHNMASLLEFMYRGEVHVSQESLSSFLKAAECLQVKGLSIEHEKLAVAHRHVAENNNSSAESASGNTEVLEAEPDRIMKREPTPAPSPAPNYVAPNIYHSSHYYENSQKRTRLMRSPSEIDALGRVSVLRDGAAFRPASAPHPLLLENHLYQPFTHSSENQTHPHTAPHTPTELEREIEPEKLEERGDNKESVAEDLRIKQEPMMFSDRERAEKLAERLSGEVYSGGRGFDATNYALSGEHNKGGVGFNQGASLAHPPTPDLSPAPPTPARWNSKINKAGTVTTPDGKKLKCPFCDRLYGYETNLRAHVRQRHQGIRVSCPFCSRTFTRNNTVRRHIAREHKNEMSIKAFQTSTHQVADTVPQ